MFLRYLGKVSILLPIMMVSPIFQYFSQLSTGRRFKSNVLSPLGWIGVLVIPPAFYGFLKTDGVIEKVFCGIIIIADLIYYCSRYEYWKKEDPDRLQSEWLAVKRLEATMGTQGTAPKPIDLSEVVTPPQAIEDKTNE